MPNRTRAATAMALAAALAGCSGGGGGIVGCTDSMVCAIAAGGQCLAAPIGFDVCAYPAAECPSGLAWSPEAGDLAGECVPSNIDAGAGADANTDGATDSGPDTPSDGHLPTCAELGCTPLGIFCTPEGACVCTPAGGSETPCTR